VALVDLPGFGASDRPDRDYPVARAASAAVAVLDGLGWPRAAWLGCSYGGHVALRAALEHPSRLAALALVSSGGLDPAPNAALGALFAEERLRNRDRAAVAAAVDLLVGRPNPETRAYRARRLALHTAPVVPGGSDVVAVARSAAGALADDAARRLEEVACPVALIHGAEDPLVPADLARAAAARFADADLRILDGVGHLPWLEDPAAVAAVAALAHGRAASSLTQTPQPPTAAPSGTEV
jgi:pimeloyl-ACP methyl ester carboxylesterase